MEHPPQSPSTPEEWEKEVYLTKVRDRLLALRNRDTEKFLTALASVDQTDEFITYGAQLEDFVVQGGQVARQFVESLGVDYDLLISPDGVSPDEL